MHASLSTPPCLINSPPVAQVWFPTDFLNTQDSCVYVSMCALYVCACVCVCVFLNACCYSCICFVWCRSTWPYMITCQTWSYEVAKSCIPSLSWSAGLMGSWTYQLMQHHCGVTLHDHWVWLSSAGWLVDDCTDKWHTNSSPNERLFALEWVHYNS